MADIESEIQKLLDNYIQSEASVSTDFEISNPAITAQLAELARKNDQAVYFQHHDPEVPQHIVCPQRRKSKQILDHAVINYQRKRKWAVTFTPRDISDIKTGIVSEIAQQIFQFLDPKRAENVKRTKAKPYSEVNPVQWGHQEGPRLVNQDCFRRNKKRNDGIIYESNELDCAFKLAYQTQILGKQLNEFDNQCFPLRLAQIEDQREYNNERKLFIQNTMERYRIIKSSDPESYYQRFGQFGLRKLDANKTADQTGEPMADYEFQYRPPRGGEWSEVPQRKFYERILYEAHGLTHSGSNLTEACFTQRFFFPNFRYYIYSFIHACSVCQLKRPSNARKNRNAPSQIIYEENPLDRLQADLIKVPETIKEQGTLYQYILTIIDHHSKKAWAKCLKNKSAQSVSEIIGKLFDKIYNRRNCYPKLLHTDNGGEFRNKILQDICREKGIKQIHGAPYHSQSQGLVERFNRTIQEHITAYRNNLISAAFIKYQSDKTPEQIIAETQYTLKSAVRVVLKEYNNRKHCTTTMTPNEAYLQAHIQSRNVIGKSPEEIRQIVVQHTLKVGNQVANKFNDYKVGDPVLVKSTLRIKIRLDGTRLIIPPLQNHRHCKYTFRAEIREIRGNSFNLMWKQDSPELGLMNGQVIYNVPLNMFVKDISEIQMHKYLKEVKNNHQDQFKAPYIMSEVGCLTRANLIN